MRAEPMGVWSYENADHIILNLHDIRDSYFHIGGSEMILLTDPKKPSYESFCYAMPQGIETWKVWVAAAARFNSYVMGIAKAYRVDSNDKVDLMVLLPTEDQSDDEAETAAAHLRINEKYEGKIFVLRAAPTAPERELRLAALSGGYTDIETLEEGTDMEK